MTIVLSLTALIYMLSVIIIQIVKYFRADRQKKYDQLKNFRKGTFGLVYLGAVPLYLAGNLFIGLDWFRAIFDSITGALTLMVLSFSWDTVNPLAAAEPFYKVTVYICFGVAICNATMFTFSLLARRIRNCTLLKRIRKGDRALCVIVGDNERNRALIKSLDRNEYDLLLLAEESDEIKESTFVHDFATVPFSASESILPLIRKYAAYTDKRMVRVIVNTENEETNFLIATEIAEYTNELGLDHFSLDSQYGFCAYVFGSDETESSFNTLSEKTHGCIRCVNRHKMMAMDFVSKHPITELLHQGDIDTSNATVKENITFNFIMIGFGKVSRHLLRIHSMESQLLSMKDGSPIPKTVNYHIYDIKETEKDRNLNHNLLRYASWYRAEARGEEYPVPQSVYAIGYKHMDIGDVKFYDSLKTDLMNVHGPLDKNKDEPATQEQLGGLRNSIVISCDTDLVNIDFAEKLFEKLREWKLDDRTQIYVRVHDSEIKKKIVDSQYPNGEVIAFGVENENASSVHAIFSEGIEAMAKRQHFNYTKTDNSGKNDDEIRRIAIETWYDSWTQVQRESNIYACLSARMKLHLLGYDAVPESDLRDDASEKFIKDYFGKEKTPDCLGKFYSREELSDYKVCRHMITRLEHMRWNAYHIACGYVPAVPSEYLSMTKKELHSVRKHANIVEFDELINQRELLSKHRGCTVEESDVIKYDYRLTDYLPELLKMCNMKIIKRDFS